MQKVKRDVLLRSIVSACAVLTAFSVFVPTAFAQTPEFLTQNLKLGSSGDEVTLLQTWLSEDKKIYPEATVNGTYGPATERAVKRYQEEKGMILNHAWGGSSYGSVGPMTRANLNGQFSKNQGGISSVEANYGDGLVFKDGTFTALSEKKYAVNVPVTARLNAWINPAALAEHETVVFTNADGYGMGLKDNGKLFAVSPIGVSETSEVYATVGMWQHLAVVFTEHDAVFVFNNEVVETVVLTPDTSQGFFERIFGGILSSFKTLTVWTSTPDSEFPSVAGQKPIGALSQKPRSTGIFGGLLSFFDSFFGPTPSKEHIPSAVETEIPDIATTTPPPVAVIPVPVKIPVSKIAPIVPPVIIGTTTIVTVVSTTTAAVGTTTSPFSTTTPPLAFGSTTPSVATSTASSTNIFTPSTGTIGGGSVVATPTNTAPAITLLGSGNVSVSIGTLYTDPGATASDTEDGNISANITVGGDTVDPNLPGNYSITYNVSDSKGLAATTATRTITVNPPAPVPESQQTPIYAITPAGQEVSYSVSASGSPDPSFSNIDINPLHVYVGQNQTFTVTVSSPGGVSSVRAVTQLDTTTLTLDLVKTVDNGDSATFAKTWDVYDTHTAVYRTTFTATANSGATNSMTMAWSDPCSGITQGSNSTLTANCTVTTVYGLDGGNLTLGGFTLTLNSGATWAFNPGKTVTVDGTIAKGSGGLLKKGYLFYLTATPIDTNTMYYFSTTPQTGYTTVATYSQGAYYSQAFYYSQSSYCFAPDTLILMANGTRKAIKDIRLGDMVMGQNEKGNRHPNIVTHVFDHNYRENGLQIYSMLNVNDGLVVRSEHPMFTTRGLVNAGDLRVGDTLIGVSGNVPVSSITKGPDLPEVFNLEVYPDHTYFAGDVLVHNKSGHQNVNPP